MRKKGFIFLETISILMVVALSLTILLASYTLVYTKAKQDIFTGWQDDIVKE